MNRTTQEDMVVIRMGIDALLESVRQTEVWWRLCGDGAALRCAQQFENAIQNASQVLPRRQLRRPSYRSAHRR